MGYKRNPKDLGVTWFKQGKKKPVGYTTKAEQIFFNYLYYEVYNKNIDLVLEHLQDKDKCITANNTALVNVLKIVFDK